MGLWLSERLLRETFLGVAFTLGYDVWCIKPNVEGQRL